MISIDNVLISDEIIKENFVCNLNACKGACCWEGDYGAPVNASEVEDIALNLDRIKPYLEEKSIKLLENTTATQYFDNADAVGTTCHDDGGCVFLTKNELGIAMCGIEQAHNDKAISINKPISCHLYPIRVSGNQELGFECWNYEEWDICSAACTNGDKLKVPVYKFLKDAIIRYKGADFYAQLEGAAKVL